MAELLTRLRILPYESTPSGSFIMDNDFIVLNTTGEFVEIFFEAEEPAIITQVGFNIADGTVAGVGGFAGEYQVTLQGIGPTGLADGVVLAQTANYTPNSSDAEIFVWAPLLASLAVQRGQRLCLKIEKVGGGGTAFTTRVLSARFQAGGFPYQRIATSRDSSLLVYGYRSSSRRYGFPVASIRRDAVNSPGQTGMRFKLSASYGTSAVLSHITWLGLPATVGQREYDTVVYDDMGVELTRKTREVDLGALTMIATTAGREYSSTVYFDDAPEIIFGREYFVVLQPLDSAQGLFVSAWQCMDAGDAAALGLSGEVYLATRSGTSGSFSTDPTVRPMIDLGFFDWGISAPPQTGFHVKFVPRYNDPLLIEHADDQVNNPDRTITGEPHEAPGFPIGGAIKSYGGFATVEVFRDPEGVFDSTTRILDEVPIEEMKILNWDPFVEGESHIVFRLRAALGSSAFVDVDQYGRLVT